MARCLRELNEINTAITILVLKDSWTGVDMQGVIERGCQANKELSSVFASLSLEERTGLPCSTTAIKKQVEDNVELYRMLKEMSHVKTLQRGV